MMAALAEPRSLAAALAGRAPLGNPAEGTVGAPATGHARDRSAGRQRLRAPVPSRRSPCREPPDLCGPPAGAWFGRSVGALPTRSAAVSSHWRGLSLARSRWGVGYRSS